MKTNNLKYITVCLLLLPAFAFSQAPDTTPPLNNYNILPVNTRHFRSVLCTLFGVTNLEQDAKLLGFWAAPSDYTPADDTVPLYSVPIVSQDEGDTIRIPGLLPNTAYYLSSSVADSTGNWAPLNKAFIKTTQILPHAGFTTNDSIPISASDENQGIVNIHFKIKWNAFGEKFSLCGFEYSTDNGSIWKSPQSGDASQSLSAGWRDKSGQGYRSLLDYPMGMGDSFSFNALHQDAVPDFPLPENSGVRIRFSAVYNGDTTDAAVSEAFTVHNPVTKIIKSNKFTGMNNSDEIQIFPNPASNNLNIYFPSFQRIKTVTLYYINGRRTDYFMNIQQSLIGSSAVNTLNLPSVNKLPPGKYVCKITGDKKDIIKSINLIR
ncbi:MAG: T9SS type A sorting domain-containing protein [bacterium]